MGDELVAKKNIKLKTRGSQGRETKEPIRVGCGELGEIKELVEKSYEELVKTRKSTESLAQKLLKTTWTNIIFSVALLTTSFIMLAAVVIIAVQEKITQAIRDTLLQFVYYGFIVMAVAIVSVFIITLVKREK